MKYIKRTAQLCALGIFCFSCSIFNKSERKTNTQLDAIGANIGIKHGIDTTKNSPTSKKGIPKLFKELISAKAVADSGLFNIYKNEERYYLEVPDSLLNRDFLIVSRIGKSAADNRNTQSMLGYGGDQINSNVIRLDRGPNHKLFVRKTSFAERAGDSTSMMYRSVMNSNMQPMVASFDIKAFSKNQNGVLIDFTDYLNGDNDILFFNPQVKTALKLGSVQADRSYIIKASAYPENAEFKTMKTYVRSGDSPFGGMPAIGAGFATYELNTSLILLPKNQMQTRSADARVGYFSTGYIDFDRNSQGVAQVNMITRWKLEPKNEDKKRYLAGELVEPTKQIVFYIDPTTPKKWVPYLIQGVNDWNIAFEKAGFKNAVVAKEAPTVTQDSSWSMEDARHNVIVYKPSAIPNASGPHVHDPRTGEILETHVNWYHNVMQLLRNWYLIQAAAVDPKARKMKFDDELMGQLIRFVSSHEVGHTLGLRHNFGSSSTVPVEKLRDKAWVEANGHTPSIMDYARFNYVAQPEDGISEKGIFPRIGDYDKWAIEWGYRWWPELPREEEESKLNNWIIEKIGNNKRLWFGTEKDPLDPRSQNEDLGDDAMLAGTYGIKNLQRIVPRLMEWTRENNADYSNLGMMYKEVFNQFNRYTGHVMKNIGGVMSTPKTVEQKGALYEGVPKNVQKDALNWLHQQVFITPAWLLDKDILSKTGNDPVGMISALQSPVLDKLFSANTVNRLISLQVQFPKDAYSPIVFLNDVETGIWTELSEYASISIYRRNLQKKYLAALIKLCGFGGQGPNLPPGLPAGAYVISGGSDASDATSIAKVQLIQLERKIKLALPRVKDRMSRYHLQDCLDRINRTMKQTDI